MDKSYRSLFTEMCKTAQVLAEQVMDYDKKQGDEKGFATAEMMRNDYQKLEDVLSEGKEPTYTDYTKLLAAAYIVMNNIQDRINVEKSYHIIREEGYRYIVIKPFDVANDTYADALIIKVRRIYVYQEF